ncbi:MAG: PAS domain S-box protein [Bacteroidia bacterium]|nr:PAS domain S-box protein [Bacteroidia bacterium]
MRRWSIAEQLGVGLAAFVAVVGSLILMGVWLITQRDFALLSGITEWAKWDKALSLWAYGALLILLLLSIGVALWWWSRIGRSLLGLRDRMRGLLWEGRTDMSPPLHLPQEAADVWDATSILEAFLAFLREVAVGQRKNAPPQATEWPAALQEIAFRLSTKVAQITQRQAFVEEILDKGMELLRLSQRERDIESYLGKAGSPFVRGIGASMGAFYLLEGDRLRRIYSHAYPTEAPDSFWVGEGWVGQVAREGQALWLTSLPAGYLDALSGLGRATPQALAVLPVIAGESIRGVWDLASFHEWEPIQRECAELLLPFFAAGLLLAEEAERERRLQRERESLEGLLRGQEEELARARVALSQADRREESLQRELAEVTGQLQRLQKKLTLEQHRWQHIVSHLSEAIVIFDPTGRPKYLSPAVAQLLGYTPTELQVFFRPVERSDAEAVKEYFQRLLSSTGETLTLRFRYRHKGGHILWLEASGRGYLREPSLEGVLLILRNVTDEIEYEKQYRTRLKFQSLVENSPDIIFRADKSGTFLYVNPTIEKYTGYSPSHYIRNTIYSVGFSLEEVRFWEGFISSVFEQLEVQSAEIEFPSVYGVRRMAVRAIPEVGPEGEVETIVVLLQDITELRQVQEQLHTQNLRLEQAKTALEQQKRELEEKNRDIMESITYARRIQGALIPGEEGLAQLFPDSFILHSLRDVVGGDFYWYAESDGHIVVAVVDCTGHGVPGAFMTFLGYTLIEAAVRERHLLDPAQILTFMHGRLRQMFSGQDTMQDGMDIALCVIEPTRRILRFAGAHRPLLLYQNARWSLISGAPTGLGGALWLDEVKSFVTHTFSYTAGDQLYLYTDGYLDQFDREWQKRYSHRRFREFLATWGHLPMAEQRRLLLEELLKWRGETPLTDDITVLGIRL